uniref:Phospholipid/glycerol acyltransferase domain-containing protein n=1 Tax=Chromera velia CCMP2878 TaxID=1169474 RepID=A0A0G4I1D2_9ALVE|eukprot:Cvel_10119.t1-p1 / transcript=Cvel_10119.t1 / gene=Cvel_10119 / organism=Chromera_velia_CCMP2878 / gene_product=1-acyl-sn-glycerol-3-phosphate acyltransferase 1,, putative / transcript_product=1-acyl-sn-glycerol-3-phosphate acyltransferase 1,, putative / location=Cvel_scaffold603:41175-44917(+) / protein_length=300 / sequence_SO=supercontig / SO=protein_coding / is_pseudo=false
MFATLVVASMTGISFVVGLTVQLLYILFLGPVLIFFEGVRELLLAEMSFRLFNSIFTVWLNPFWRVKILRPWPSAALSKLPKANRIIVVSNHLSGLDPWIVAATTWPVKLKYVYKASLKNIPIAGYALSFTGDLAVSFTKEKGGWGVDAESIRKMMQRARHLLEIGIGICVFPEGTRSLSGRLQPFKDGFFRLAVDCPDTHVVPMAMMNTNKAWPVKGNLISCATIFVVFGDPISCSGKTVDALKKEVRDAVAELQRQTPGYDPEKHGPMDPSAFAETRGHGPEEDLSQRSRPPSPAKSR